MFEIKVLAPRSFTPPDLTPYLERGVRRGMQAALARVQQAAPRRTGRLAQSFRVNVVGVKGKGVMGFLRSKLFYGRFLEAGAAGHFIAPRSRGRRRGLRRGADAPRALRFGGIFRAHAHHPGVRPRRFAAGAVEASLPSFRAAVEAEVQRAMKDWDRQLRSRRGEA